MKTDELFNYVIGIDVGKTSPITFSRPLSLYGKMTQKLVFSQDFMHTVTWTQNAADIINGVVVYPSEKCRSDVERNIINMINQRKDQLKKELENILEENEIKVLVIEHAICLEKQLMDNIDRDDINSREKYRYWVDAQIIGRVIDWLQDYIISICKEKEIGCIQLDYGYISTYRCNHTMEVFTKSQMVDGANFLDLDHTLLRNVTRYNNCIHTVNSAITGTLQNKHTAKSYDLATQRSNIVIDQYNLLADEEFKIPKLRLTTVKKRRKNINNGWITVLDEMKMDMPYNIHDMCTIRRYICPVCGEIHDRDVNAAKVIANEGYSRIENLILKQEEARP
jgi:hypothetical protein